MNSLRRALRAATWKMTLARAVFCALAAVAVAAALWTILVLLFGKSSLALSLLAAAAFVATVIGAWVSRAGALDAARRVEQLAGWQERLSTAIELESTGADNAFYLRLRDEVEGLLRQTSPSRLIPWDLQRPAVAAVVLGVAAAAVTALFPGGLRGSFGESPDLRRQAALIVQEEVNRFDKERANTPGIAELRARLVNVLDEIRGNRPADEVRNAVSSGIANARAKTDGELAQEAKAISEELAKLKALMPIAGAVRRLDPKSISSEAEKLASGISSMPANERKETAGALSSAANESKLPGLADPLKEAARALDAADPRQFIGAFAMFAAAMDRRAKEEEAERQAANEVREALTRTQSVLEGHGDPGSRTDRQTNEFFAPGKPLTDNATGAGNLVVRSKPEDIKHVWEATRTADASVPKLTEVINNGLTASQGETFNPEYREYVKKYFTPEVDNGKETP